jgi:hypothetical protein
LRLRNLIDLQIPVPEERIEAAFTITTSGKKESKLARAALPVLKAQTSYPFLDKAGTNAWLPGCLPSIQKILASLIPNNIPQ